MMTASQAYDVVILGAGAAGLMCALTAGLRGRKVLLLDRADQVGAKILISGGGRCNFTNLHSAPDRFLSGNTDFCRSALSRYTQNDFIALVERHGIAYHEKTLGQLFCDGSARAILAMLLAECAEGRVDVRTGHTVTDISRGDHFRLETSHGTFTLHRRWCWRPAACRSRKWERPAFPMTWRGALASVWPSRCRH
jgi:predicted Rossmann fold flavoprotein